jgi:hypothetical protein
MLLSQSPRDWRIDREWQSIADPVSLPEEARKELEFAIYIIRFFSLSEDAARRTPPKKLRTKFQRAAQIGRDFIAGISSLSFTEEKTLRFALPSGRKRHGSNIRLSITDGAPLASIKTDQFCIEGAVLQVSK